MSILKQVAELSAEDCRQIELLESKIDLKSTVTIMHYGEPIQRKLANFISQVLRDAIERSNSGINKLSQPDATNRDRKELERQRLKLLANLKALDKMHQQLLTYHKQLVLHILAGERMLAKTQPSGSQELQVQHSTTESMAVLEQNELKAKRNSFADRLNSLAATETLCLQTAAELQLAADASRKLASAFLDGTLIDKLQVK